jgi:FkbM family methyltransferase
MNEWLTMTLMPSSLYYRRRIADEAVWGEHELDLLGEIVAPGGTAIDVGANQGFFAYAFSKIVDKVEAFEPNPDCAAFARRMLGARARVHEIALSNTSGTARFGVPISDQGIVLHLAGNLVEAGDRRSPSRCFNVEVRTLDSYAFKQVRAIKVDVEGSEMEVLRGGRETILRERPSLIVELLTGAHSDPIAVVEAICRIYGYSPWIVTQDRRMVDAVPVIRSLASNTTWGSPIRNRNVLFLPHVE